MKKIALLIMLTGILLSCIKDKQTGIDLVVDFLNRLFWPCFCLQVVCGFSFISRGSRNNKSGLIGEW